MKAPARRNMTWSFAQESRNLFEPDCTAYLREHTMCGELRCIIVRVLRVAVIILSSLWNRKPFTFGPSETRSGSKVGPWTTYDFERGVGALSGTHEHIHGDDAWGRNLWWSFQTPRR